MNDGRGTIDRWRTACAVAMMGALLAGCQANSLASGSGSGDPMQDLLGDPLVALGVKADPNQEYIEYGPRSPLVMPPSGDLPPPQQAIAMTEGWPDDPDERQRREYEAARRAALQEMPRDVENAPQPMSRADLDEWGRRFGRVDSNSPLRPADPGNAVNPAELRARSIDPNAAPSEPPRRALTDPPSGYRMPAPTVAAETQEEPRRRGLFGGLFGG